MKFEIDNMAAQNIYSIKLGGQAGQGVKVAGLQLAKVASRSGYHIHTYTEYPSLIRGGHNVMQILISEEEVTAPVKKTNLLIALNQDTINKHLEEIPDGGGIIYDGDKRIDTSKVKPEINLFPVPLSKIATDAGGGELLMNTVSLGATVAILGGNLQLLKDLIAESFGHKDESVVTMNHKAAEAGYTHAAEQFAGKLQHIIAQKENVTPPMIVNGNEAVALGAIAGGVQFAAIYPMSPISNILHVLAAFQEKYGYIYKQPEDEIAAINMAIGAAFAGARAFTTTSGGGFCLMTEAYGLAAISETPLVIVDGMRPGPATGLPTWTAQGDLQFALRAHQGDFPRIVLAAGDGKEAFELTMQAFNLADKYQTPVIVLIDKNICEDDHSYPMFDITGYQFSRGKFSTVADANFARYALSEDGISTRSVPGAGNFFIGTSYEHTDQGFESEESEIVIQQQKKRMQKMATCAATEMQAPVLYGPEEAEVTIVSWGSNKGAILQALKELPKVNFMHITWMSPFPTEAVKAILAKAKKTVLVEANYTGQLGALIREHTGIEISDKLLKIDGRPVFPEEIVEKITSVFQAGAAATETKEPAIEIRITE